MSTEVREHYGLLREFQKAGFYETAAQKQMFKDVKADILLGKLIALTGIIGCGKTATLRKLSEILSHEGKVVVSRSYSVEKQSTTIETLISALFYDLSSEKEIKIPTKPEKRERELCEMIKTSKNRLFSLLTKPTNCTVRH